MKAGEKREKVFDKGAGTVYIFKIYHCNLNFITEHAGIAEGVLIRALEPTKGIELMKQQRGVEEKTELASGPGRLTEALGITKEQENRKPVEDSNVSIYDTGLEPEIEKTGRIGISEAKDWPLRFTVKGSDYVSTASSTEISEDFDIGKYY